MAWRWLQFRCQADAGAGLTQRLVAASDFVGETGAAAFVRVDVSWNS